MYSLYVQIIPKKTNTLDVIYNQDWENFNYLLFFSDWQVGVIEIGKTQNVIPESGVKWNQV